VTSKEALQKAADEARKAGRAARELGTSLDDYAKYLTQPGWQERADELRRSALNKLSLIQDGLTACNKWIEEGSKSAVVQQSEETQELKVSRKREVLNTARVVKRGGKK
jgi:hypothetical protein